MKNKSAIILLFLANTISGIAQGLSVIAIPWYFTGILGETSLFGIIYLTTTFVSLFWSSYTGTLVDRFNRKHLFLAETSVGTLLLCGVAGIGFLSGGLSAFWVGAVFLFTFLMWNLHYPALYAFAQEISAPEDYSRIASYLEILGQSTNALSGAVGALLLSGLTAGNYDFLGFSFYVPFNIESWSIEQVFLVDGLTYFISFLLILPMRYVAIAKRKKEAHITWSERFKIGLTYLKKHPLLFIFINASYFIFVTTMLINFMLMPNFVKNYLEADAHVYALSESAFAFGAIFSAFFISKVFNKERLMNGALLLMLITATCFCTLIFDRHLLIFYLIMVFLGISNSGSRVIRVSYIFNYVPNQVIGRVQSIFHIINVSFRLFFIGLFSLPFFVNTLPAAFGIFFICCLIAAGVIMWCIKKQ